MTLGLGVCLGASGCDGVFGGPSDFNVEVFASHHGVKLEDGTYPNYGEPDSPRSFVNDLGWEVFLDEGWFVVTQVFIRSCAGDNIELPLSFGPFPENVRSLDLDVVNIAGAELEGGEYCTLLIQYGPYDPQSAAQFSMPHSTETFDVAGATVKFRGSARMGDVLIPFEVRSNANGSVNLDISKVDEGAPFGTRDEPSGLRKLTFVKTYDRFFAGIDFNNFDQATFEANLITVLADQTYVITGTSL
ncbi:MAG: hypothetical protein KC636_22020 [Myxococcales bacterium]|nr:hypothetical protein [Myxococcales bacterium]